MSTPNPTSPSSMRTRFGFSLVFACASSVALVSACGGGDGPGVSDECGFANRYLPYENGYGWTYNVTDLGTGIRTTKTQSLSAGLVTSDDFPGEMFIEQTTLKATGTTVSLLQLNDEKLERFRQEDFDDLGASERVTIYDPGKLRLDETADRLEVGASYVEPYTSTVDNGSGPVALSVSETWEIMGVDVACESPFGTFECLHIRRTRTEGGAAVKDFYFAEGIGKVREEGDTQVEELAGCSGAP